MISTHVYWFRLLSVIAFAINVFLIKKFAEKLWKLNDSLILVFLYIFSGYFIIFDWQVRMYTLVVTLILSSLLVLSNLKSGTCRNVKVWIGFTLINFLGLYIDYTFIWYFVPAAIFSLLYFAVKKDRKLYYLFYSYIWSCLFFVFAIPSIFITSSWGINGIKWMAGYISPGFFIPFFLGSHTTLLFTLVFLLLLTWGIYNLIRSRIYNFTFFAVVFSSLFSLILTLIYSHFFTPLFHVRSLQIVGFSVVLFYYFGLTILPQKIKPYVVGIIVPLFLCNFILVNNLIIKSPGSVIIDYFPWRDILDSTDLGSTKTVKYKINRKLPTLMLLYGLEYTLKGNENIGRKSVSLGVYKESGDNKGCVMFYNGLMGLYKCP